MTTKELMIACAERVAEAANSAAQRAAKVAKDAKEVAISLRETNSIPINQTGWWLSPQDVEAVNTQDREWNRLYIILRNEAIAEARARKS